MRNVNICARRWNPDLQDPLLALDVQSLERKWMKAIRNTSSGATQSGFVSQLPQSQVVCLWSEFVTSLDIIISFVNGE